MFHFKAIFIILFYTLYLLFYLELYICHYREFIQPNPIAYIDVYLSYTYYIVILYIRYTVVKPKWLPEVHAEANTSISLFLAGLLLKLSLFTLLRFILPLYWNAFHYATPFLYAVIVVSMWLVCFTTWNRAVLRP